MPISYQDLYREVCIRGIKKNIELTIIANKDMSLFEGHNFCNKIEKRLEEVLGNTDVTIHLEPDV